MKPAVSMKVFPGLRLQVPISRAAAVTGQVYSTAAHMKLGRSSPSTKKKLVTCLVGPLNTQSNPGEKIVTS